MFREAFPTRPGSSRGVRLCACAIEKTMWPSCVGADASMSRRRRICTEGASSACGRVVSTDVPGSREIEDWAYLVERRSRAPRNVRPRENRNEENEHGNNETQRDRSFRAQLVDARRGRHGHGPRRGLPRRRWRAPRGGEDSHRRRGVHAFHEHGASGRRARRHRGVPRGPRQRDLRRRPARHAERRGRPVPPRARGERAHHGHRYASVRTPAVAPAPAPAPPRARPATPEISAHARWAPASGRPSDD